MDIVHNKQVNSVSGSESISFVLTSSFVIYSCGGRPFPVTACTLKHSLIWFNPFLIPFSLQIKYPIDGELAFLGLAGLLQKRTTVTS